LLPRTKDKYYRKKDIYQTRYKYRRDSRLTKIYKIKFHRFFQISKYKINWSYLNKDKLKIICFKFCNLSAEDIDFLIHNDIFPYEYVDCEKLQDARIIFSLLMSDILSESDYDHAANVWQQFSIRTLGEYSDLYLKNLVIRHFVIRHFRKFPRKLCRKLQFTYESCISIALLYLARFHLTDDILKHTRVKPILY